MSHFSIQRHLTPLAALCALMLLSACAATGKKTETIEDRVNGRWAALLGNDVETAYKYLTPGYRSSVSLQQYQREFATQKMKWTSAKYVKSECEQGTCVAQVQVGYTIYGVLPGVKSMSNSQYAEETWILIDGTWYLVPPQ